MQSKIQGNRRNMREAAFKVIFASLFIEQTAKFRQEIYRLLTLTEEGCADADILVDYTLEHMPELLEILSKYCTRYKVERLFYCDKAFLLLALAEMQCGTKTANVIIIDEVVTLAKKYCTEHGVSFINGVLAAYIKDIELDSYITDFLNIEEH